LGVLLKYHTYHHNLTLQVAMHPDYFLLVKGRVLPLNGLRVGGGYLGEIISTSNLGMEQWFA
jgi:hypothetical protein